MQGLERRTRLESRR